MLASGRFRRSYATGRLALSVSVCVSYRYKFDMLALALIIDRAVNPWRDRLRKCIHVEEEL